MIRATHLALLLSVLLLVGCSAPTQHDADYWLDRIVMADFGPAQGAGTYSDTQARSATGWTDNGSTITASSADGVGVGGGAVSAAVMLDVTGNATRHTIALTPGAGGEVLVSGTLNAGSGSLYLGSVNRRLSAQGAELRLYNQAGGLELFTDAGPITLQTAAATDTNIQVVGETSPRFHAQGNGNTWLRAQGTGWLAMYGGTAGLYMGGAANADQWEINPSGHLLSLAATAGFKVGAGGLESSEVADISGSAARPNISLTPGASGTVTIGAEELLVPYGATDATPGIAASADIDTGIRLGINEIRVVPGGTAVIVATPTSVAITGQTVASTPISGANGLGPTMTIREAFSLAVDTDQTVFAANFPFAARVVDVSILVSTGIASRTITLRTATGGVGTALSDAFDAATTGVKRNAAKTTTDAIAANSTLAIRAAGGTGTVVGEMIVTLVRE